MFSTGRAFLQMAEDPHRDDQPIEEDQLHGCNGGFEESEKTGGEDWDEHAENLFIVSVC